MAAPLAVEPTARRSPPDPAAPTRGRRPSRLLGIRSTIPATWRIALGLVGVAVVFAIWIWGAGGGSATIPTPLASWKAFTSMVSDGSFQTDLWASAQRVAIGYAISMAIGVALGIAIGSFASVEAFFEPQIGFLRYIPAPALLPLFLLLLGFDETPKIWLIVVGTVFYNVLMIADVARNVPREMLNASYTLGAGRRTILRRVILPHSLPGIIDVARINLAAAWSMLVVAELLGAKAGLAYTINLSQRFRAVDVMFALLIVFGVIGIVSDVLLRRLRWLVSPWARS
ncbi:ABC transporter permease [Aquihabitans sp. G128]|uniref:ABC transporter permease n=1 Tax=Aquihabitans sp. G128 TaxID=2849779 RepID=UPI001C21AF90|nr:ABC transporter permease [Aquihabitans sp. G128]QXC62860.1 ABC transporter permease [Aquihabitans sp. G128]